MLGFLRRRPRPAPAQIPAGERVYAIGDVHGHHDTLRALLATIAADDTARGPARTTIVQLGDLIDRGPASAQVIALARTAPGTMRFVQGNHEEMMLAAFDGAPDALRAWLRNGGDAALRSYGIGDATIAAGGDVVIAAMQAAIPAEDIAFLRRGEDMVRIGDYAFVHAGIRPGVPLDRQAGHDLRWIREPFLHHRVRGEAVIVHGHTITTTAQLLPHRIGIDTGAGRGGPLTALGLERGERWLLTA